MQKYSKNIFILFILPEIILQCLFIHLCEWRTLQYANTFILRHSPILKGFNFSEHFVMGRVHSHAQAKEEYDARLR